MEPLLAAEGCLFCEIKHDGGRGCSRVAYDKCVGCRELFCLKHKGPTNPYRWLTLWFIFLWPMFNDTVCATCHHSRRIKVIIISIVLTIMYLVFGILLLTGDIEIMKYVAIPFLVVGFMVAMASCCAWRFKLLTCLPADQLYIPLLTHFPPPPASLRQPIISCLYVSNVSR